MKKMNYYYIAGGIFITLLLFLGVRDGGWLRGYLNVTDRVTSSNIANYVKLETTSTGTNTTTDVVVKITDIQTDTTKKITSAHIKLPTTFSGVTSVSNAKFIKGTTYTDTYSTGVTDVWVPVPNTTNPIILTFTGVTRGQAFTIPSISFGYKDLALDTTPISTANSALTITPPALATWTINTPGTIEAVTTSFGGSCNIKDATMTLTVVNTNTTTPQVTGTGYCNGTSWISNVNLGSLNNGGITVTVIMNGQSGSVNAQGMLQITNPGGGSTPSASFTSPNTFTSNTQTFMGAFSNLSTLKLKITPTPTGYKLPITTTLTGNGSWSYTPSTLGFTTNTQYTFELLNNDTPLSPQITKVLTYNPSILPNPISSPNPTGIVTSSILSDGTIKISWTKGTEDLNLFDVYSVGIAECNDANYNGEYTNTDIGKTATLEHTYTQLIPTKKYCFIIRTKKNTTLSTSGIKPSANAIEPKIILNGTSTLSGTVFIDRNANGAKETGEEVIKNAKVEVYTGSSTLFNTFISDNTGSYTSNAPFTAQNYTYKVTFQTGGTFFAPRNETSQYFSAAYPASKTLNIPVYTPDLVKNADNKVDMKDLLDLLSNARWQSDNAGDINYSKKVDLQDVFYMLSDTFWQKVISY